MAGHLVVVVHGIGEQVAGETVDAVLAGAIADHQRDRNHIPITVETEVMEVPEYPFPELEPEQGDPDQPESLGDALPGDAETGADAEADRKREVPHFPMHLRHVRSVNDTTAPATTLVDMYWADISPAPKGQLWIALDFVRTLLGIGYLAMENVRSHGSRFSYRCVMGLIWIFYAGIAAINSMLLVGLGLLLLEGQAFTIATGAEGPLFKISNVATNVDRSAGLVIRPEFLVAIAGGITVLGGLLINNLRGSTQLTKQFARGLLIVGLAVLAFVVATSVKPDLLSVFSGREDTDARYINHFVDTIVRVMGLIWCVGLVCCLATYATTFFEARADKRARASVTPDPMSPDIEPETGGPVRIYASICSALILLWMVCVSAFWVFVEWVVSRGGKEDAGPKPSESTPEVDFGVSGLAVDPVPASPMASTLSQLLDTELAEALGGMTVAGAMFLLLVIVGSSVAIRRSQNKHKLDEERHETDRRILLNQRIQLVFAISTFCISATAFLHVLNEWNLIETAWLYNEDGSMRGIDGLASLGFLGLALGVYTFQGTVSGALGVIRDITVYSTTRRLEPWPELERQSAVDHKSNFPIRANIEARFTRVLEIMIWSKKPDRVTIVSHSLGTIVATRCLGKWLQGNDLPDGTLITMGSPVTHIYRRYFPRNFEIAAPLLQKIDWINIFRKDDFVGTYISGLKPPVCNLPVAPGGHSGYFNDDAVWKILRTRARFSLEPRPAAQGGSGPGSSGGEGGVAEDQDAEPPGGEDHGAGGHLGEPGDHADRVGDAQAEEDERGPVGQG